MAPSTYLTVTLIGYMMLQASALVTGSNKAFRYPVSLGVSKNNKAMEFLKKVGKLGHKRDFTHSMGVDEGPAEKSSTNMRKLIGQQPLSRIIDDCSKDFPQTSHTHTDWAAFTDQVMGGVSTGTLSRKLVQGRPANVLEGHVSLANNGGFLQMATNLGPEMVDGRYYEGVEVDVLYQGERSEETFNIHLKNAACAVPFASYRASFRVPAPNQWTTVQLPWKYFVGYGPGAMGVAFDPSSLIRAGIVAIGREMEVSLAVGGIRFYRSKA